jgi:hypothetical protein
MATWLPVRAFNRSQGIRIGKQKITSVDSTGNLSGHIYIDLDDKTSRKELAYHTSIGGLYVSGTEFDIAAGTVIGHGGRVTVTSTNGGSTATAAVVFVTNTAVLTTSAPVYSVDTSVNVVKPASGTWSGSNVCDVLIQINTTTGVVSSKTSAAAASGSQVTPTADSGNIALAKFTLTYDATNHTYSTVTSLKPYVS